MMTSLRTERTAMMLLMLLALGGTAIRAQTVTAETVVAGLDEVRLPRTSFFARVEIEKDSAEPSRSPEMEFLLYARREEAAFSTLAVIRQPAEDQGKMVLSTPRGNWFRDPRAQRPTRVFKHQMWKQSIATDSLSVRYAIAFWPELRGRETIATLDRGEQSSLVVDLVPKEPSGTPVRLIRYWTGPGGESLQARYFGGPAKNLLQTVRFGEYQVVLGRERPTLMEVDRGGERYLIRLSDFRPLELPAAIFEVGNLSRLQLGEMEEK